MNGVNILSEKRVCKANKVTMWLFGLASFLMGFTAIVGFGSNIIVGSVFCMLSSILFAFLLFAQIEDRITQYDVTIEDYVTAKEFLSKYNVVAVRENIFTIEFRKDR